MSMDDPTDARKDGWMEGQTDEPKPVVPLDLCRGIIMFQANL